jgi:hypothetical protein
MCTICLCSQAGACQHVWGSSHANIVRSAASRAEGCHDSRNIGVSRRHHPWQTVPHLQLLWREARQDFLLLCCHARALCQKRLELCDAELWLHPCMQSSRCWWLAVTTFCSRRPRCWAPQQCTCFSFGSLPSQTSSWPVSACTRPNAHSASHRTWTALPHAGLAAAAAAAAAAVAAAAAEASKKYRADAGHYQHEIQ